MKQVNPARLSFVAIPLVAIMTSWAVAQVGEKEKKTEGNSGRSEVFKDEIPADLLNTREGQEIAEKLRNLRRAEARFGPNHPSTQAVQAEIRSLQQRLGILPQQRNSNLAPPNVSLNEMSDEQLRILIRRMALRIESLETRLDALERRLEIF